MPRALPMLLSLLAGGLAAAACGGKNENPIVAAVAKSEKAGSADVALSADYVVLLGNTTYTLTGRGVVDPQGGAMTYDVGDFLNLDPTLVGTATEMKAVYAETQTGPIVYSSYPFITRRLPAGKRWMKLDLHKALIAVPYATLLAVGNTLQSPADLLDLLRTDASVTVVAPGHYRSTTRFDATQSLGLGPQTMSSIITTQGALTDGRTDVWVSPDGYVSKLQIEYDTSTVDQIQSELTVTLRFSNWGTRVGYSVPPPATVQDATQDALRGVSFRGSVR
jgi:hypothetical protein